jgi:hypothetical protein
MEYICLCGVAESLSPSLLAPSPNLALIPGSGPKERPDGEIKCVERKILKIRTCGEFSFLLPPIAVRVDNSIAVHLDPSLPSVLVLIRESS